MRGAEGMSHAIWPVAARLDQKVSPVDRKLLGPLVHVARVSARVDLDTTVAEVLGQSRVLWVVCWQSRFVAAAVVEVESWWWWWCVVCVCVWGGGGGGVSKLKKKKI
jgi:hypothetical protein